MACVHIREAARLFSITDHGERLVSQKLAHENGQHAAHVDLVEAGSVDIEVADNDDGKPHFFVGKTKMFGRGFGRGIAPAVNARGTPKRGRHLL